MLLLLNVLLHLCHCLISDFSARPYVALLTLIYLSTLHSATYDVQHVELHGGTRSVFIQCMFASGSQARGCRIEIRNSSIQITQNITKVDDPQSHTAEQTVTGLTPGSYEVLIFDWERDGSFASTPSYTGHISVTEVLPVQPTTIATG